MMMRSPAVVSNQSCALVVLSACVLTYTGLHSKEAYVYSAASQSATLSKVNAEAEIVIDPKARDWAKFEALASAWRAQRGVRSSVTEIVALLPYQKIIGMGETAVPLILSELAAEGNEPDLWFPALTLLTDADPVAPEHRGNMLEMAKAWLSWGEKQYGGILVNG